MVSSAMWDFITTSKIVILIKNDWHQLISWYGTIGFLLFHLLLWNMILMNIVTIIMPLGDPTFECVVKKMNHNPIYLQWLTTYVRIIAIVVTMYYSYIVCTMEYTYQGVGMISIHMISFAIASWIWWKPLCSPDCLGDFFSFNGGASPILIDVLVPFILIICIYYEKQARATNNVHNNNINDTMTTSSPSTTATTVANNDDCLPFDRFTLFHYETMLNDWKGTTTTTSSVFRYLGVGCFYAYIWMLLSFCILEMFSNIPSQGGSLLFVQRYSCYYTENNNTNIKNNNNNEAISWLEADRKMLAVFTLFLVLVIQWNGYKLINVSCLVTYSIVSFVLIWDTTQKSSSSNTNSGSVDDDVDEKGTKCETMKHDFFSWEKILFWFLLPVFSLIGILLQGHHNMQHIPHHHELMNHNNSNDNVGERQSLTSTKF